MEDFSRVRRKPSDIPQNVRQLVGSFGDPQINHAVAVDALLSLDPHQKQYVIRACFGAAGREGAGPYARQVIESYLERDAGTINLIIGMRRIEGPVGAYASDQIRKHIPRLEGGEGDVIKTRALTRISTDFEEITRRTSGITPTPHEIDILQRDIEITAVIGVNGHIDASRKILRRGLEINDESIKKRSAELLANLAQVARLKHQEGIDRKKSPAILAANNVQQLSERRLKDGSNFYAKRGLDYLKKSLAGEILIRLGDKALVLSGEVRDAQMVVKIVNDNGEQVFGEKVVDLGGVSLSQMSLIFDQVRSSVISLSEEIGATASFLEKKSKSS